MQGLPPVKPDREESRFDMVRLGSRPTCDEAIAKLLPDEAKRRGITRSPTARRKSKPAPVQSASAAR